MWDIPGKRPYDTLMDHTLKTPDGAASTEQLVILAKGFSRIFWGIPIALLLFIGAISINFIPAMRLPSYVFGILLIYWGMVLLYRAGKMYLSSLRPEKLGRLLEGMTFDRKTAKTLTDADHLRRELEATRARGYSTDNEEFIDGMAAIAVAIHDDKDRLLTTLSLHAPVQRHDPKSAGH
ncbi:MAG: IclR family transcriptional regulator C-terminal domain-containing protein, partial [Verrucomicrobiota bacterium]